MRYLYYTIQTLRRGRTSSFIKLLSLTLGLLVGVLLFAQIAYELNYENCYPESDRLAMVRIRLSTEDTDALKTAIGDYPYDGTVYDVVAPTLAEEMAEWVESATTINTNGGRYVYYGNKLLEGTSYIRADTAYFRTMGIEVLEGDQRDLLRTGATFVSESFAKATFGDESPIGKELTLDKQDVLTVRGVYRDMPQNTFLGHYDFVASVHANGGYVNGNGWRGNDMFNAILRLRRAGDVEAVNDRIQQVIERHTSTSWDGWKSTYSVIPLPDLHTDYPDIRRRLAILGFLGFALFFVAAMNYILISIATLSRRAKAVGVHKCNGAGEGQVFTLFMLETGAMVLAAAVLSALLLWLFAGGIESWLGISVGALFTWQTLWVPLLTVLLLVVVAGVLPGRMFARIPVTQVFRRYTDGKKGWKRGLLAVQFAGVSFVLGLLMVTVMQYSLLMNGDMGFRIPGLVQAESWQQADRGQTICDYIERQPYVEGATAAAMGVLGEYWTQGLIGNDGKRITVLNYNPCQKDYAEVMGIEIIEGKPMEKIGDVLVNEEVVRLMNWTDGAVGKRLNNFIDQKTDRPIVGVFRDVRNKGMRWEQQAIALVCGNVYHAFDVRLKEPYDENLDKLNDFVSEAFPDVALNFISVAEMQRYIYMDTYRFRNAVYLASVFIILIVLMGLIGYVNDETGRRAKEIAIRKVNGASAGDILRLLSRGVLLIAVPCVAVGSVVAWYVGTEWLTQFAGQVSISPWHFVGLAVLLLVVIVCIVVLKAWHIANENPVESIKAE